MEIELLDIIDFKTKTKKIYHFRLVGLRSQKFKEKLSKHHILWSYQSLIFSLKDVSLVHLFYFNLVQMNEQK